MHLDLNSADVEKMARDINTLSHYLFLIYMRIRGEMARDGHCLEEVFHFFDPREQKPTDKMKARIVAELRRNGFRVVHESHYSSNGQRPWRISWEKEDGTVGTSASVQKQPKRKRVSA